MLSQRSLEAFRAVIECGTVSGAAENLHVSQPAGSRLIKDLEDRTGLQLFTRFGGKIVPTPEARALYAQGYSLQSLRKQCYRAATWDKHHDRYEGVKIVFRALTHGQPALALPALGGLFAEDRLPHLETARLRNRAFMEALYRLSWLADKTGMVPVNWRAMETEELGSVYESLLELQPQLGDDGKTLVFASEAAEQKGNQRKTTGSYYTPDSLVQALLDTALDPVLDKTEAEADDPAKALLKLSVIDPACGSGHFLLAAARRIATRLARIRAEGTPSLADFRHALRDVARCCIHGVDRNPMAVELTKVALWIETVDPGLPLGFFDAQIRCGDALLGVFDLQVLQDGIPDAAYKPLTGDDKETAKYYLKANRDATAGQGGFDFGTGQASMPAMKPLALDFSGFRDLPEDTVEQIGAKAKRFKELRKGQTFVRAKAAADLYVAAFLLPKVGGAPAGASARTVPTTEELWMALNQGKMRQAMVGAPKAARNARALHWPLEFPDVMQRGGFDVVLGNPPWERIKLQEQEFFAAKSPAIAAASNKSKRQKLIRALEAASAGTPERSMFDEYISAKREAEASSEFIRIPESQGGRFALSAKGDVNTYAVFSELGIRLASPRGRCGIIVPSGLATDSTTKDLFGYLVESRRLRSFVEFENEGFFLGAGQGHMLRFSLTTISGRDDPLGAKERTVFLFQGKRISDLLDNQRVFYLSAEEIVLFSPNSRTMPIFQSSLDAELFGKIYHKVPVLVRDNASSGSAAPDPWGMKLSNMFHMSNDSDKFRLYGDVAVLPNIGLMNLFGDNATSYWPLYEAKMMNAYTHRYGDFSVSGHERSHILPEVGLECLKDPNFEPMPYYWISKELIDAWARHVGWKHKWYLGWRNITDSRASARTVVASVLPESGIGNSINIMMPDFQTHGLRVAGLIGNLSALVLDFIARKKVGGLNLNFFTMKQFAFLPPDFYTEPRLAFITPKVLELSYTSHSLTPFARDLGHDGPPFAWDEDRRAHLRADLDAFYARAYGLTRDELRYILDPADVKGPDYPSETFRVLKEKEIRQHGEYRTRRLVLEAWDRMEANGEFAAMGM